MIPKPLRLPQETGAVGGAVALTPSTGRGSNRGRAARVAQLPGAADELGDWKMYRLNKATTIHSTIDIAFPRGAPVVFAPEGVYIGEYLFVPVAAREGRRWYVVLDGMLYPVHFPDGGEPYPFAAYRSN